MRVVIQLHPATELLAAVADPGTQVAVTDVVGDLPGFALEHTYDPIHVPGLVTGAAGAPQKFSGHPADGSVLVRGEIPDDDPGVLPALAGSSTVSGVFADPVIESVLTCGSDRAVGTWHDVENLLHTSDFATAGLTADGVAWPSSTRASTPAASARCAAGMRSTRTGGANSSPSVLSIGGVD